MSVCPRLADVATVFDKTANPLLAMIRKLQNLLSISIGQINKMSLYIFVIHMNTFVLFFTDVAKRKTPEMLSFFFF